MVSLFEVHDGVVGELELLVIELAVVHGRGGAVPVPDLGIDTDDVPGLRGTLPEQTVLSLDGMDHAVPEVEVHEHSDGELVVWFRLAEHGIGLLVIVDGDLHHQYAEGLDPEGFDLDGGRPLCKSLYPVTDFLRNLSYKF